MSGPSSGARPGEDPATAPGSCKEEGGPAAEPPLWRQRLLGGQLPASAQSSPSLQSADRPNGQRERWVMLSLA